MLVIQSLSWQAPLHSILCAAGHTVMQCSLGRGRGARVEHNHCSSSQLSAFQQSPSCKQDPAADLQLCYAKGSCRQSNILTMACCCPGSRGSHNGRLAERHNTWILALLLKVASNIAGGHSAIVPCLCWHHPMHERSCTDKACEVRQLPSRESAGPSFSRIGFCLMSAVIMSWHSLLSECESNFLAFVPHED